MESIEDSLPQFDEEQELAEEEAEEQKPSPALVINIQSWATPILGLVMLALGLLGGYFGRPLLDQPAGAAGAQTAAATVAGQQSNAAPTPAGPDDATRQEMMAFLIGQTRHFKGDANAPVTIIEFSDFQ